MSMRFEAKNELGMKIAVIILAAGKGKRLGAPTPKQYLRLPSSNFDQGPMVLTKTLDAFTNHPDIFTIQPVIGAGDEALFSEATLSNPAIQAPVIGGMERADSVAAGLIALKNTDPEGKIEWVLIHDAARPFVSRDLIDRIIQDVKKSGAAIPVLAVSDTIKQSRDGRIIDDTVPRSSLWRAQTPQAFHFKTYLNLLNQQRPLDLTDDASLFEHHGLSVSLVSGEDTNFKITTRADFDRAKSLMKEEPEAMMPRIGTGYDVHRFEDGDHVTLCGVRIEHDMSLKGHSDADVGLHALTDALFGAMADGDIGFHFPPSDQQWAGQDSAFFLDYACQRLKSKNGVIGNIDVTLICERPKIGRYRDLMCNRIAEICKIDPSSVSVKATTTEKLGFTGRKEGIAAQASILIMLPPFGAPVAQ